MPKDEAQPSLEGILSEETIAKDESKDVPVEISPSANAKIKGRVERKFPSLTFVDALSIAEAIQKYAAGQKVRRLKLFEQLNKSPDSSTSRQLVTSSGQYGLTKGGYNAEHIDLTPEGRLATAEDTPPRKRLSVRFELAIEKIAPFKLLYDRYKGNKLPAKEILADNLNEASIPTTFQDECVDTFIVNAKNLNLLRTIAGSERLISIEQAVEDLPESTASLKPFIATQTSTITYTTKSDDSFGLLENPLHDENNFANTCFYVTPIGDPDSPERRHADFMMEYVVQPALTEFKLIVIRADQMSQPGMIGRQVVEHILKCRLVIADLSFHNPNVFYELCLRHTTRLPTVQIKRAIDRLPFDLNQQRTISIDTNDVYGLYPKLQIHISEVATQVRRSLQDLESADNPISLYYPKAKLSWE